MAEISVGTGIENLAGQAGGVGVRLGRRVTDALLVEKTDEAGELQRRRVVVIIPASVVDTRNAVRLITPNNPKVVRLQ